VAESSSKTERDQAATRPAAIEVPAATQYPFFAALGVTLLLAGLVTHVFVSLVGLGLVVAGASGWWREVLPSEHAERVPVRPPAERARPIATSARKVEHLQVGQSGHRVRIPVERHTYGAGLLAGLVGAATMAVLACLYGVVAYGSPWYPVNLLAATVMPSLASASQAELAALHVGALIAAAIIHLIASLFVGLIYAAVLPTLPRTPVLWGGVLAPLVWSGLLWAVLGLINPTLEARIDWRWFVASQIGFGLAAGLAIVRTERVETMQSWPLATRAGIEAGTSEARAARTDPPEEPKA